MSSEELQADLNTLNEWDRRMQILLLKTKLERIQQLRKWAIQTHEPEVWLTILNEEVGEAAEEMLNLRFGKIQGSKEKIIKELIQVAAVALAAAQCLEHGEA
jgi:NTP pyrophosphatase (non-canonical NTP hydrolase)